MFLRCMHLLPFAVLIGSTASLPAYSQSPASEQPAPDQGAVRIISPQPSATVYIDNALIGDAPVASPLPAGTHTIRVSVDGFDPFVRRVEVVAGQTTEITAELIPGTGTVDFQTDARGASVRINGDESWPLPVRLSSLPPGSYSYEMTAPGRELYSGDFRFSAGQNIFIYQPLEVSRGKVTITSEPSGASVWMGGEMVGVTPLQLQDVPAAEHSVRLEHKGYATVFRTLDTTDGSRGELRARLPEDGATLVIRTRSAEGEVFINGQSVGVGRTVTLSDLERGFYDVAVIAPGYKSASTRLDVPMVGRTIYATELQPLDTRAASRLNPVAPFYQRWTFWTAAGVGSAATIAGGYLLWQVVQPAPVPTGDVVVSLP